MSVYQFRTPEGETFAQTVKRARARRDAAARRAMKRLESEPHRHYRRNFTEGKACQHEEGCDAPAYAIDPLRKRARVFVCRKHYMRSHRVLTSPDPEARDKFRAKYGY